jgi:hypothetical protein
MVEMASGTGSLRNSQNAPMALTASAKAENLTGLRTLALARRVPVQPLRAKDALVGVDRRQRDFRGEGGAVPAVSGHFHPGTQRAGLGVGDVSGPESGVHCAAGVRDQDLDRLADQPITICSVAVTRS